MIGLNSLASCRRRMLRSALHALRLTLVLVATLGDAGGALAHAVVLETDPTDGALLEAAPTKVVVLFNEPVSPVRVQVVDAAGDDVTPTEAYALEGSALRIAMPPDLPTGSYIASYRVVSIDSHAIAGSIVFSVGQVSSSVSAPAISSEDAGWRIAMAVVRGLLFAGLLGGAGGVLFLVFVHPSGTRDDARIKAAVRILAAGGCLAAVLAMGVQGGLLLNGPAASILEAETWRTGGGSRYGRTAIAALVGLAVVVMSLRSGQALRPLAGLGAVIALAGFGLSGHVVTSGPRWLTIPSLMAHTAAAAFWAGSLLPLWLVLQHDPKAAAAAVQRFSRVAVVAVAVLFLAGVIIAVLQVRAPGALLATGYGLALTLKLLLVVGLLALAAYNKHRLTRGLARGSAVARINLQRTILAEVALVLAILATTGVLGTRPPPRVLAESAAHTMHVGAPDAGLSLTIIQGERSAEIIFASARSGINRAQVMLRNADGTPLEVQELTLLAANPGAGVEPIERAAERGTDGAWRIDDMLLAPAGRWTIRLVVLVSDFEQAIMETRIDLSPPPSMPADGA